MRTEEKSTADELFRRDMLHALTVRWMGLRDIDELEDLDASRFYHVWTARDFRAAIADREAVCLAATLKTASKTMIAGYAVAGKQKKPPAFYLIRLAVHSELSRLGIGSRLLHEAIEKRMSASKYDVAYTSVYDADPRGQLWLAANGWICYGVEDEMMRFVFRAEWRGL